MIKLAAFDWNGTILSDTMAVVKSESEVLKYYGHPPTNLKKFQALYTIPIRDYWVAQNIDPKFFDEHAEEIHLYYMSRYEPREGLCRSRAGSREILSWLKSKKIKAVIYSNHTVPHIEKQLKRLRLDRYIDKILGRPQGDFSHMHGRSKDVKLYDHVRMLKLKPKEVITVGDTDEEVEIAQKLGYYSVALTGGYNNVQRLKAAQPDFLIHNLAHLKVIIKKINS